MTSTIIAAIEAEAGDWQMPWHRSGQGLSRPVNIDTANAHRGINVVNLWASAMTPMPSKNSWPNWALPSSVLTLVSRWNRVPFHAIYLDNWLKVLKADNKAIFTAASAAARATDYLPGL